MKIKEYTLKMCMTAKPGGILVIHLVNRELFDPILESFIDCFSSKYAKTYY